MARPRRRLAAALVTSCCALGVTACGGDDQPAGSEPAATRPADDLASLKTFLLDHTERLQADAADLRAGAEDYHAQVEAAGFDYAALLESDREAVASS